MSQIAQIDNRWKLSGDVMVNTVNAILTASQGLPIASYTVVDFADVADIDTAALSLILEWKRRAQLENKTLSFVHLPANLNSLAALYGVSELIN
jgi:phospholipid transport system transporter-binding protein